MTTNKIKVARVAGGLTQEQLAKKLGRPQSWVSLIENGGLGEARLIDVIRLCEVLGISLTEAAESIA